MIIRRLPAMLLAVPLLCQSAQAQSYNPSLVYQNPDSIVAGSSSQWTNRPCRDPWINIAYAWGWGATPSGRGDEGECLPKLYSQGKWSNYNQLIHAIARYRSCSQSYGYRTLPVYVEGRPSLTGYVVIDKANRLVAQGGANLVAQGGGTLVAQGGGNFRITVPAGYKLMSLSSCAN